MIRPILLYPHPLLERPADKVEDRFTLNAIADDLLDTLVAVGSDGVGLSAPQIGISLAVFVVRSTDRAEPYVLGNPLVEPFGRVTEVMTEGCLSMPGLGADVVRPEEVTVTYRDRDWEVQTIRVKGFLARAIQHEMDHLDGLMYHHRLSPIKRRLLLDAWKKFRRERVAKESWLPGEREPTITSDAAFMAQQMAKFEEQQRQARMAALAHPGQAPGGPLKVLTNDIEVVGGKLVDVHGNPLD
jgi:peptide deformylase